MEQIFKTKRINRWWYYVIAVLFVILLVNACMGHAWAMTGLASFLVPCLMWYSQQKTLYRIKENGVLSIEPRFGNKMCITDITAVTYTPHSMGMQKVKIEHSMGFVMVNPEHPHEFAEALKKIYPTISVRGFELINN